MRKFRTRKRKKYIQPVPQTPPSIVRHAVRAASKFCSKDGVEKAAGAFVLKNDTVAISVATADAIQSRHKRVGALTFFTTLFRWKHRLGPAVVTTHVLPRSVAIGLYKSLEVVLRVPKRRNYDLDDEYDCDSYC